MPVKVPIRGSCRFASRLRQAEKESTPTPLKRCRARQDSEGLIGRGRISGHFLENSIAEKSRGQHSDPPPHLRSQRCPAKAHQVRKKANLQARCAKSQSGYQISGGVSGPSASLCLPPASLGLETPACPSVPEGVCRNLKSIVVQVGIADYFKEPNSAEARKMFEEMVNKLQVQRLRPARAAGGCASSRLGGAWDGRCREAQGLSWAAWGGCGALGSPVGNVPEGGSGRTEGGKSGCCSPAPPTPEMELATTAGPSRGECVGGGGGSMKKSCPPPALEKGAPSEDGTWGHKEWGTSPSWVRR